MKIGLYFGSFNPIHTGHLIIANHVLEHSGIDRLWFVVSPHNPLKKSTTLLNEYDRMHMVQLAIANNTRMNASNVEFSLPKPSYTAHTLTYLSERQPKDEFVIVMGSDSYVNLPNWKNYEYILKNFEIVVYERPDFPMKDYPANVTVLQAPMLDISATFIRNQLKANKSIQYLVPDAVNEYILENRYYTQ